MRVALVVTTVILTLYPSGLVVIAWLAVRGRRGATVGATIFAAFAGSALITVGTDILGGVTFAGGDRRDPLWLPESRDYARRTRAARSELRALRPGRGIR